MFQLSGDAEGSEYVAAPHPPSIAAAARSRTKLVFNGDLLHRPDRRKGQALSFSSFAALRPRIFALSASFRPELSTNPRGSYHPMS